MRNPKVSIIVPVYNAQERLSICIESVLHQTYNNFELILVNDGSMDNSAIICEDYKNKDSRVKVINKGNGGVSSARNVGIKISEGEFITFVDSDDTIDHSFLENALVIFKTEKSDVLCSSVVVQTLGKKELLSEKYSFAEERTMTVKQLFENLNVTFPSICICGPWAKLYKSEIIRNNNIVFNESLSLGEDTMFNLSYFSVVSRVTITNKSFYFYYRGNDNSLFSKFSEACYEARVLVYNHMRELMRRVECSDSAMNRFEEMYVSLLIDCIYKFFQNRNSTTYLQRKQLILDISQNEYIKAFNGMLKKKSEKIILKLLQRRFGLLVYLLFAVRYR